MRLGALFGVCALVTFGRLARAAADATVPGESAPLFFVSKSENKNQVSYAIRLDPECRPAGETPVFAYWRMLERSPVAVEPLLALEEGAYGIGQQHTTLSGESGGSVVLALRSLPDRTIVVRTHRQGLTCVAEATTRIADLPARLFGVHARLAWPFGVAALEIAGWAQSDGHVVRETIRP